MAKGFLDPIDLPQWPTPANPSAGTRRVYTDSSTGKVSALRSDGTVVSLEEQGGDPLSLIAAGVTSTVSSGTQRAGVVTLVVDGTFVVDGSYVEVF